jgi:hypothetical protein
MDYEVIAKAAGCRPEATEDVVRRCEAKFQGEQPSPETVTQWLVQTLKPTAPELFRSVQTVWERLGMTEEVFNTMPPAWRKGQADLHRPQVTTPHPRRPVYRNLTPAELTALDATGLTGPARTELARQWQQTPLPAP